MRIFYILEYVGKLKKVGKFLIFRNEKGTVLFFVPYGKREPSPFYLKKLILHTGYVIVYGT